MIMLKVSGNMETEITFDSKNLDCPGDKIVFEGLKVTI